jgi:hypothetical protein
LTTYFSLPHVPTQKQAAPGLRPSELANGVSVPGRALDVENIADEQAVLADDELLRAEWYAAITDLPPPCQRLIALLAEDPPLPLPKSAPGSVSRSAASGPPAVAAWPSCAATRPSPP